MNAKEKPVRVEREDGTYETRYPKTEAEMRKRMLEKLRLENPAEFKKSVEEADEAEEEMSKKSDKPYIHTENRLKLQEIMKLKEKEAKEPELTSSMLERLKGKSSAEKKSFLDRLRGK